jgi:hypothetical protein
MNNYIYYSEAVYQLYPNVISMNKEIAYDAQGNVVDYDINAVNEKAISNQQAQENAKSSALAKLAALGLSVDEIKALVGA